MMERCEIYLQLQYARSEQNWIKLFDFCLTFIRNYHIPLGQ